MAQLTCPHCHKPVSEFDKNCPRCGATIHSLEGVALQDGEDVVTNGANVFPSTYDVIPNDPLEISKEQIRLLRSINGSLMFFKVLAIITLVIGGIVGLAIAAR